MLDRLIEGLRKLLEALGAVAINVWAAMLFLLAGALAFVGHAGHDKDLLTFAGTVATTGAALFQHGNAKKD